MAKEKIEKLKKECRELIEQNQLTLKNLEAEKEPLQTEIAEFRKSLDEAEKNLTSAQENVKSLLKNLEGQEILHQDLDKEIAFLRQNLKKINNESERNGLDRLLKLKDSTMIYEKLTSIGEEFVKTSADQTRDLEKSIYEKQEKLKGYKLPLEAIKTELESAKQECSKKNQA